MVGGLFLDCSPDTSGEKQREDKTDNEPIGYFNSIKFYLYTKKSLGISYSLCCVYMRCETIDLQSFISAVTFLLLFLGLFTSPYGEPVSHSVVYSRDQFLTLCNRRVQ